MCFTVKECGDDTSHTNIFDVINAYLRDNAQMKQHEHKAKTIMNFYCFKKRNN